MVIGDSFQEPDYSQESNFRTGVANLFTNYSGTCGTVTSITAGSGILCTPADITTVGSIALDADLNDLNDVNITSPVTNQVLTYNGNSWVNQAMTGGVSIAFTALTDTPSSLSGNSNELVAVNNNGTSLVFINNNYKNNIIAGTGIDVIDSTNSARVIFNSDSIINTLSMNSDDKFIIEESAGNRRIEQANINISGFNNDSGYLIDDNFFGTSPITLTKNGNNITIGLSTGEFDAVNFNNGVSGILPIAHGGTGAGTSSDARTNLELVYNVDVLSKSGPIFTDDMKGDNILLRPNNFTLSISAAGSSYSTGAANLILAGYEDIDINITGVDGGGGITNWTATDGGISFIGSGNYPFQEETWQVVSGPGVGGTFVVTPEINYINFGTSHLGVSGFGFRNNYGSIEVKNYGGSWQSIYPITVDKIDDLITTGASSGDIFIYNGTSWLAQEVQGFINIDSNGTTNYAGGLNSFNPANISALGASITPSEFSTLSGMSSSRGTIQVQLDSKVGSNVANSYGDLIYYDNTGPSTWVPLSIGASRQILTTGIGTSPPTYDYLNNILIPATSVGAAADIETVLLQNGQPDQKANMSDILTAFTGLSGGIDLNNNNFNININQLNTNNNITADDELAFFDIVGNNETNKITVDNFCQGIAGGGLCASGGNINLANPLPLGVYTYGTSPSGSEGDLVYFQDGDAGAPCLGVHDGICWRVVSLGAGISPL